MKHLNLILVAFGISLLFACYSYESVNKDELDLTLTVYDEEVDFSTYNTFVIRDSVGLVSNYIKKGDAKWNEFYAPGGTSDKLRDAIEQEFTERGYTKANDLASADFAINNVVTKMESTSYYYPGWWWGYPGYWPGYGWGGYYPPYYPPYYPGYGYSYSTYYGTVFTEMIDAQSIIDSDEDTPIDILWQTFINGVISNNLEYNESRVQRGYDEAFEQSPYLK